MARETGAVAFSSAYRRILRGDHIHGRILCHSPDTDHSRVRRLGSHRRSDLDGVGGRRSLHHRLLLLHVRESTDCRMVEGRTAFRLHIKDIGIADHGTDQG